MNQSAESTSIPAGFVREMVSTKLAEVAWMGTTDLEVRAALLRVAAYLVPTEGEAALQPFADDFRMAINILKAEGAVFTMRTAVMTQGVALLEDWFAR